MKHYFSYAFFAALFLTSCSTDPLEEEILDAAAARADKNKIEMTGCETAYANSGADHCFLNDGFNRWGWYLGPLSESNYQFPVYAAAGQCDVDKGTLVAMAFVNYHNGEVHVELMPLPGYSVTEQHVYAGKDTYPRAKNGKKTVAPGSYSIQEDLKGQIYVIIHAVVCEDDSETVPDPAPEDPITLS